MNRSLFLSLILLSSYQIYSMENEAILPKDETGENVKRGNKKNYHPDEIILTTSNDDNEIPVLKEVIDQSITIKEMLEDLKDTSKSDEHTTIPLPMNVKNEILQLIIPLLVRMYGAIQDQETNTTCDTQKIIKFDGAKTKNIFIPENVEALIAPLMKELSIDQLKDIILTTNYLDIPWLTNLSVKLWTDKFTEKEDKATIGTIITLINKYLIDEKTLTEDELKELTVLRNYDKNLLNLFIKHLTIKNRGAKYERTIAGYVAMFGLTLDTHGKSLNFKECKLTSVEDCEEIHLFADDASKITDDLTFEKNYIGRFPNNFFQKFTNLSNQLVINGNPLQELDVNSFINMPIKTFSAKNIELFCDNTSTENVQKTYFSNNAKKPSILIGPDYMHYWDAKAKELKHGYNRPVISSNEPITDKIRVTNSQFCTIL